MALGSSGYSKKEVLTFITASILFSALSDQINTGFLAFSLNYGLLFWGEQRVVGSTRFANIDRPNRRAEIGWTWIAPAWQRTVVNTEAKYLMLRHAFEVWGFQRVVEAAIR